MAAKPITGFYSPALYDNNKDADIIEYWHFIVPHTIWDDVNRFCMWQATSIIPSDMLVSKTISNLCGIYAVLVSW